MWYLLYFINIFVGIVPMFQEISIIVIVHTDVHVVKGTGEEIIDFTSNVQNVTNSETNVSILVQTSRQLRTSVVIHNHVS